MCLGALKEKPDDPNDGEQSLKWQNYVEQELDDNDDEGKGKKNKTAVVIPPPVVGPAPPLEGPSPPDATVPLVIPVPVPAVTEPSVDLPSISKPEPKVHFAQLGIALAVQQA